jgi:hypothetical protein
MAFQNYARFLDPKYEPNFNGLSVSDIEIDSIEITKGQFLPIRLLCDFEWDEIQWLCTNCFIQTQARAVVDAIGLDGLPYKKTITSDDYVNAIGKDEWAGLIGMVEGWANEHLQPEDFL